MCKILLCVLIVFRSTLALAEEQETPDIAGHWVTSVARSTCLDGTLPVPARRFASQITRIGDSYRIRAIETYSNARLENNRITASYRPVYTVNDTWRPGNRKLPASVINDINRHRITLRFQGRLSEDGKTISGTDQSFCFKDNGFSVTDGPDLYTVRITMTRAEIAPAIVSIDSQKSIRPISTFSVRETVHIAAYVSENWPDRTVRAQNVIWTDKRERLELGPITLTRSGRDPAVFLSPPITIRSAMVEDTPLGANFAANSVEIWGRAGTTLTAEIVGFGTAEATLALYSILEAIMETTTALLLFAMLAFLVERLTNGVSLILGYFEFWRRHFEEVPGAGRHETARNYRNRRVFLFFLGIAVAVPLCVFFGFNIIDQLQLPAIDPVAEQVGTGLLAATGADPIREVILGGEGGEGRFFFNRSSGPKTIHVEAQLVAPPGSTIHVAEANKDQMKSESEFIEAAKEAETKVGEPEAAAARSDPDNDSPAESATSEPTTESKS